MSAEEPNLVYQVVVNEEEQYSIWPSYKKRPKGWTDVGPAGTKAECLDWIEKTWVDLRPRSLREVMRLDSLRSAPAIRADLPISPRTESLIPLPDRLCRHEQHIRVARCSDAADFKAQLDRGYVLLEFLQTAGGTELGCPVSSSRSVDVEARFDTGIGKIEVVAQVRVDYELLRILAVVDLSTLEGVCTVTRSIGAGASP